MVFQVPYNRSKMLFQRRSSPGNWTRLAQLSIAILSLLVAAAILGTAAHTFHVYRSEKSANNPWWLPLWPSHFDVSGTEVYLGTSSALVLLSAIYLALHFIPAVSLQQGVIGVPTKTLTTYRSRAAQRLVPFSPSLYPSSVSCWQYQPSSSTTSSTRASPKMAKTASRPGRADLTLQGRATRFSLVRRRT
jgi:hypothetical protein